MPRAKSKATAALESEEEVVVKAKPVRRRASRKRAIPGAVEGAPEAEVVDAVVPPRPAVAVARKAPARLPPSEPTATVNGARHRNAPYLVMGAVLVVGVAASALIGMADKGTIDVNARMNEMNNQQVATNDSGAPSSQVIPVQNTSPTVPNAGLRGRGAASKPAPAPTPEESTGTSTATSSDTALTTDGEVSEDLLSNESAEAEVAGATDTSVDTDNSQADAAIDETGVSE